MHNYGLTIDIALCVDKDGNGSFESSSWQNTVDFDGDGKADWMEVINIFKKHSWEWGGNWKSIKDYPHIQKTWGLSWQQLLKKYQKKILYLEPIGLTPNLVINLKAT